MATVFRYIMEYYTEIMEKKADPRVENLPLMSSPLYILGIILFYNYFVNNLGPQLMKSRQPFDLRYFMIFYNSMQIALNVFMFYQATSFPYIKLRYNLICEEVDYSNEPNPRWIAQVMWIFLMMKIFDLIDTVLMVLRKKQNQVTFLHTYHHSGMIVAVWIGVKFVAGGNSVLTGTINSFIHIIMYTYYLLTVLYPEYKKSVWWKKHITELQMIQFVILFCHSAIVMMNPYCNYPKPLMCAFTLQNIIMLFLFWEFYKTNYFLVENTHHQTNDEIKANNKKLMNEHH